MAAPQSFVPPKVTPSRPRRRFTLELANRTLPLVSRIVADVVKVHREITTLQEQLERMQAASKHRAEIEQTLQTALERLHGLLDELAGIGCELKDFQTGLVDFVGRHQNRDVYLCWKLGETAITHWHELDAGFAGRKSVDTLEESD